MKTIHSFEIVEEEGRFASLDIGIHPECKMTIHSEASLDDMLEGFHRFLQAAGYCLPENSRLDFVEE